MRVLDDQAEQVSLEPVLRDATITVPLESGLADGTYTITYEVVSADSHRITGASIFHIGVPLDRRGRRSSDDGRRRGMGDPRSVRCVVLDDRLRRSADRRSGRSP